MKYSLKLLISLALAAQVALAATSGVEPLPEPVSNNAVAILKLHGQFELFSLMGIGAKKTWNAVTNEAYELDASSGKAYTIHSVPGTAGRIGAMAVGGSGRVFLFGGYVLYQGGGMAVPDANFYEPASDRWVRLADIPIPVGDAVIGLYRERYIYLVGGRSNGRLITDVQVYDLEKNRWLRATSIPGSPVFGHAGALVGDTIIFVDGARINDAGQGPRFVASDECWKGKIDHHNPARIDWSKLPSHPGNARFRIAAGGSEKDEMIYFSGGSDNPHDYNGMGYDGKPSEPSAVTFAFNLRNGKWETLNDNTPDATMDHRGLLVTPEGLVIIGGMEKGQQVTGRIEVLPKTPKK
jgi:N-acetylneuraminic acid mutarotase